MRLEAPSRLVNSEPGEPGGCLTPFAVFVAWHVMTLFNGDS